MTRKKLDRGFLVPPVRSIDSTPGNVVPLKPGPTVHGGVTCTRSTDDTILSLRINLPGVVSGDLIAPEEWLACPYICEPFAEAFYLLMVGKELTTQRDRFYRMSKIFRTLASMGQSHLTPASVTTELCKSFRIELERQVPHLGTRRIDFGLFRSIVYKLASLPAYSNLIEQDIRVEKAPWKGANRAHSQRRGFSIADLVKIEKICIAEIKSTIDKIDEGNFWIRGYTGGDALASSDYPLSRILHTIDSHFGGYLPSIDLAHKYDANFGAAIEDNGGLEEIWSYLHLKADTIVAFIVLFATRTAFNSGSCLGIRTDCVKKSPLMTDGFIIQEPDLRHKVKAKKNRARIDPQRSYPAGNTDIDNPVIIVGMVNDYTNRIRPHTSVSDRSKLFIYPSTSSGRVRGLDESANTVFNMHLKRFIARTGVVNFRLSNIRPTISDLIDLLTSGDVKARQTVLNHQRADTTLDHYNGAEPKARAAERLGSVLNERERWMALDGKLDPRQTSHAVTRRAATGGFECLDPYDSPIVGEVKGRLCRAWGACATCPLAAVNSKDAQSLARLVQLQSSINDAKYTISPLRWIDVWGPRLHAIETVWLPKFKNAATWAQAESIKLVPFGMVE